MSCEIRLDKGRLELKQGGLLANSADFSLADIRCRRPCDSRRGRVLNSLQSRECVNRTPGCQLFPPVP